MDSIWHNFPSIFVSAAQESAVFVQYIKFEEYCYLNKRDLTLDSKEEIKTIFL
jgi:hypothetical protein